MIWLCIATVAAGLAIMATTATKPISFALGLIQTASFFALVGGLFGWFAIIPDQTFLWWIGIGGGIWLLTSALRRTVSA